MCRNVVTEMSRDWNGPDRNGLTETARPNRPDRIGQIEKSRTRPPSRYSLQNAIKFDKVIVLFTVKKHFERYHCMNSTSKILRYTFSLCFFILCVCLQYEYTYCRFVIFLEKPSSWLHEQWFIIARNYFTLFGCLIKFQKIGNFIGTVLPSNKIFCKWCFHKISYVVYSTSNSLEKYLHTHVVSSSNHRR